MFGSRANALHDRAKVLAISRIGVGAPYEYDEQFARKLEKGLLDGDESVWKAALAAGAYRDWPGSIKPKKKYADHDSKERCRKCAAYMMEVRRDGHPLWM